ncbi:MAG: hypothetical protein ACOY33_10985 [Pseudomonadota bacterium]
MDLKRCLLGLLLMLATLPAGAGTPVVRVVGPEPIATEVRRQLQERVAAVDIREEASTVPARLVVAIGARAFRDALQQSGAPVVGMALTRESYRAAVREMAPHTAVPHTAVFWDPDPVRQLQLARLVLPAARRVAILADSTLDEGLLAALRTESVRLGLVPVIVRAGNDSQSLPQRLARVLANTDFLLGIDGPEIFTPANAKTILLTTYRHGRPVIGPGGSWVDAGSIASLAAGMPEAIDTLAAWLPALLETGRMPPPRHPDRYTVVTNPQVARSLSITLPPDERLQSSSRGSGGKP